MADLVVADAFAWFLVAFGAVLLVWYVGRAYLRHRRDRVACAAAKRRRRGLELLAAGQRPRAHREGGDHAA